MPVTIACPTCGARLAAPNNIAGKKVECMKCGQTFRAQPEEVDDGDDRPAPPAAKPASKSRPRPADDDGAEDKRPSRPAGKAARRREEEEDDRDEDEDRPRRSRDEGDPEGEPRPRKKKGKKARKGDRPVVLLLSIGIGVLVVVGVIGAILSSGDPEANKAVPADGPAAGPGGGGESADNPDLPGWLEFADPNGHFKVRLPRAPAAPTKQQWVVPNGDAAEATIYTVEIGGGQYAVAHLTVPALPAGAPVDPVFDEAMDGGMGWFKGAVIKSRAKVTHQGFPGRQAVLEYPGVKGSTVLRVILAGSRMFWVVAKGDNFAADTPKVRGFFDSLKIN